MLECAFLVLWEPVWPVGLREIPTPQLEVAGKTLSSRMG